MGDGFNTGAEGRAALLRGRTTGPSSVARPLRRVDRSSPVKLGITENPFRIAGSVSIRG